MAQLERTRRSCESPQTPRAQTSPTFEQLLRVEDAHWAATTSPTYVMTPDHHDENISPTNNKKSVLTKVKEKAKKLKHTLSGKKKHGGPGLNDDNSPPSWSVTTEDYDDIERDDDPEYLGAPMYESEAAPENYKEMARQHPRAVPVVSENHTLTNTIKCEEAAQENDKPISPNKTITETVSEKLSPAYSAVSNATHTIASKIANLTVTSPSGGHETPTIPTPHNEVENLGNAKQFGATNPQKWDKGVSVKEYFMTKLEPGEDEKALSQAITEAISPRKTTGDTGVVEKVKEAVSSFFWHEEASNTLGKAINDPYSSVPSATSKNHISSIAHSSKGLNSTSANSSHLVPVSTIVHEGKLFFSLMFFYWFSSLMRLITVPEEENHGKILQAN